MNGYNRSAIIALTVFLNLAACCELHSETTIPKSSEAYEQRFSRAEELMKKGVALGREKKYGESAAELRKAIELIPDNGPLWYNLGMSLYKGGEISSARNAWQKTVSLRPDYADAWYMLGMIDARENRAIDAIVAYEKSSKLKPQDGEALESLIKECLKFARKNFEQLQKIDPARAKKLAGDFTGGVPSSDQNKHPLADTVIPGTGKTFDELLEIFKRTPCKKR
ncbi:MAG: tetratricopeptide repeat protein [Candidatus Rifleibacteriota bacterium]